MANVMLPSVFALVPWVVNGVNLNDGNRLLYLCVVVFGVVLAYFVHLLSKQIIKEFLEHR